MTNTTIPDIEPEDMPSFLNELAAEYFQDNLEIRMKLAYCSAYIHGFNWYLSKKLKGDE